MKQNKPYLISFEADWDVDFDADGDSFKSRRGHVYADLVSEAALRADLLDESFRQSIPYCISDAANADHLGALMMSYDFAEVSEAEWEEIKRIIKDLND